MNYTIKQKFTAKDFSVGDLVYDARNDIMLEIAHVGDNIYYEKNGVKDLNYQIVVKDVDTKELFILEVVGKEGFLPRLQNDTPRFRHLIKKQSTPSYSGTLMGSLSISDQHLRPTSFRAGGPNTGDLIAEPHYYSTCRGTSSLTNDLIAHGYSGLTSSSTATTATGTTTSLNPTNVTVDNSDEEEFTFSCPEWYNEIGYPKNKRNKRAN